MEQVSSFWFASDSRCGRAWRNPAPTDRCPQEYADCLARAADIEPNTSSALEWYRRTPEWRQTNQSAANMVHVPIAGVDPDIGFGQVAGPELRSAFSLARNLDGFRIPALRASFSALLPRTGPALRGRPVYPAYRYLTLAGSNATAAYPRRREYAPSWGRRRPWRSSPEASGDGSSDLGRGAVVHRAAHVNGYQPCGAFAVAGDLPRQRFHYRSDARLKSVPVLRFGSSTTPDAPLAIRTRCHCGSVSIHRQRL